MCKIPSSGVGKYNHFIYKSYYIDYEVNLYYLKSRYYNSDICRFISSDKIEYIDPNVVSGLNLYCYCMNDPISGYDPDGTISDWLKWTLFGIGIAGMVAATIVTFGAAGTVAATVGAAVLAGGLVAGGINATRQLSEGELDVGELGISMICGEAYGLIMGLTGGSASFATATAKVGLSGAKSFLLSWNNDFEGDTIGDMTKSMVITTFLQTIGLSHISSNINIPYDIHYAVQQTAFIQTIAGVVSFYLDEAREIYDRMRFQLCF